jgi:hypothetical protein
VGGKPCRSSYCATRHFAKGWRWGFPRLGELRGQDFAARVGATFNRALSYKFVYKDSAQTH